MTLRLAIALLLASALPASAADAPPTLGAGVDVVSYSVAITPDIARKAVAGRETIAFTSTADGLRALAFSPNALAITGATVDGVAVTVSSGPEALVFGLPAPLAEGRSATLRFRLSGVPARGVEAAAGAIYTSYFACDWMVCLQDSPGDKAMFALDLSLPKGLGSLSIGGEIAPVAGAGGRVVHRWRTTRGYSPYLYGFAAGPFAAHVVQHRGATLSYLDATGGKADLAADFAATPAMVDFLAGIAGLPLPAGHYTQLLVPGDEAQEAATFSLIGTDPTAAERGAPRDAWVIVHELSHQWWGNLVTCATWRDLWLDEGMATFLTAAWKEHLYGAAGYKAELDVARARLAKARALGFDKPLAWGGTYPSLGARRAVQYSKGALFLDHLRGVLGEAAFWEGIRMYTRENAGGTVTSAGFERAMERASGRDLSGMFGEWVFGVG